MEPGKVQKGDHVFYVNLDERSAKLFRVEAQEVIYPGTTHETVIGRTYDVDTSNWIEHHVSCNDYWLSRETALDQAKIKLVDEMQRLRAQAMSLGFHLR